MRKFEMTAGNFGSNYFQVWNSNAVKKGLKQAGLLYSICFIFSIIALYKNKIPGQEARDSILLLIGIPIFLILGLSLFIIFKYNQSSKCMLVIEENNLYVEKKSVQKKINNPLILLRQGAFIEISPSHNVFNSHFVYGPPDYLKEVLTELEASRFKIIVV